MRKIFLLLNICLGAFSLAAQPVIEWQRAYGGTRDDEGSSMAIASDGGCFVAGYCSSNNNDVAYHMGYNDGWILKLGPTGDILWQRSIGGSSTDQVQAICATADGGCALICTTYSTNFDLEGVTPDSYPVWVLKFDAAGNTEWQHIFGDGKYSYGTQIQQTSDGALLVTAVKLVDRGIGFGTQATWLFKLDDTGNMVWEKTIDAHYANSPSEIRPTADGGYILAGSITEDGMNTDWWTAKLNAACDIQWEIVLAGNDIDYATNVIQLPTGGFLVAGSSYSYNGPFQLNNGLTDVFLIKLTSAGAIQWKRNYGGEYWETPKALELATDGSIMLLADAGSNDNDVSNNHGGIDFWLLKLNIQGQIKWTTTFGGNNDDQPSAGAITPDGGYIMTGLTKSLGGDVLQNNGMADLWVVKATNVLPTNEPTLSETAALTISPNPAQNTISIQTAASAAEIQVVISDMLGNTVLRQTMENEGNLNITQLPAGVYQTTAVTPSGAVYSAKLVKI